MNTDKENINRMPGKSRIPLPLDPLPALSENLLNNLVNSESEQRHPLKTINNQQPNLIGSAGPSKRAVKVLNGSKYNTIHLKLDTRHVTLRKNSEGLDWDYMVFKDKSEEEKCKQRSIITISDDDNDNTENAGNDIRYFAKNPHKICHGEPKKIATPVFKSLEPNRIRNIKRSLKRPHSKELQGVPSAAKQLKREEEKHKRRLNCNDRLQDRLQSPDLLNKLYMTCLSRDYICDMYAYLLRVEDKSIIPHISSITRACVINWLMKVNGADGDPTVVQTACWFLDAFLGVNPVQLDKLQLLATACYWISQKLHGSSVQASRLVKCANRAFSAEQLITAEKAVLKKLKFPRHPVVPQDYITYLSWWCDNAHPGEIEVAATFLCMSGVMVDRNLCDEYPSVVGAAAVRNALLLLKKIDLLTRLETCSLFKATVKKSSNMSFVCSVQRKAVRRMCDPLFEYKAPFEQYGCGPHYIAQKIVTAANNLARYRGQDAPAD